MGFGFRVYYVLMQMSIVIVFRGVKFHYLVTKKNKNKRVAKAPMDIFEFFWTIITIFASRMFSRSQCSKPHEEPHPFENMFALIADTHHR